MNSLENTFGAIARRICNREVKRRSRALKSSTKGENLGTGLAQIKREEESEDDDMVAIGSSEDALSSVQPPF